MLPAPLLLLFTFGLLQLLSAAIDYSCPHETESSITHFDATSNPFSLIDSYLEDLNRYSERQMGIFRFLRFIHPVLVQFSIDPASSQSSILSLRCHVYQTCISALIVPNPWTKRGLLMRTIETADLLNASASTFTGFDNDWVAIQVTNSSAGMIRITLCDGSKVNLTLLPRHGSPTAEMFQNMDAMTDLALSTDPCTSFNNNVSLNWRLPCTKVAEGVGMLSEQIDRFVGQQRNLLTIKIMAMNVLLPVAFIGLIYIFLVRFMFRMAAPLQ